MRLIWGESFSSSAMMSCKNMCIMKKGIDKCDYVGFSIFPKILAMCPSHFNPNRSSLNVPEHILAVHIFPLSILFLSSQTGSFKIWTACTIGLSDFARRLELKLTTLLFFLKKKLLFILANVYVVVSKLKIKGWKYSYLKLVNFFGTQPFHLQQA